MSSDQSVIAFHPFCLFVPNVLHKKLVLEGKVAQEVGSGGKDGTHTESQTFLLSTLAWRPLCELEAISLPLHSCKMWNRRGPLQAGSLWRALGPCWLMIPPRQSSSSAVMTVKNRKRYSLSSRGHQGPHCKYLATLGVLGASRPGQCRHGRPRVGGGGRGECVWGCITTFPGAAMASLRPMECLAPLWGWWGGGVPPPGAEEPLPRPVPTLPGAAEASVRAPVRPLEWSWLLGLLLRAPPTAP